MHAVGISFIFSCTAAYAFASANIYRKEPVPERFDGRLGCFLSSLNKFLLVNEPYYPQDKCEKFICQIDGSTHFASCGLNVVDIEPHCRVTYNMTLKYPGCCEPFFKCDTRFQKGKRRPQNLLMMKPRPSKRLLLNRFSENLHQRDSSVVEHMKHYNN